MNIRTILVRPVGHARVRTTTGAVIPPAGTAVPATSYYLRLIDAGDLEQFKPDKASKSGSKSA